MPLDWLGQLKPSMKEQIALQRALLALQRENEEIRAKTMPQPALARGLEGGGTVKPYAGPTPTSGGEKSPLGIYPELAKPYFREGAGSLEEALRAAGGGPAPDIQAEAWARRKEIVEENQAKLDAQADALYQAAQGLSKKDQDYILSKVVTKGKPSALAGALGAEPGAISPAAIRTDPLMKTMMDKNYIKKTATGYDWMLPEEEPLKPTATTKWTDESGWTHITTTFADGTTKDETIGREAPEAVKATGPSVTEQLAVLKYEKELSDEEFKNVPKALELTGPRYGVGETDKDGKKVKQADVDNWNERFDNNLAKLNEVYGMGPKLPTSGLSLDNIPDTSPEVKKRKEEIVIAKARVENNPGAIRALEATLGLPQTGTWSPQLEFMLYQYSGGGQ